MLQEELRSFFFETARILREKGHEVAFFSTTDEKNLPSPYASYFVNAPNFRARNLFQRVSNIGKIVYSREAKKSMLRILDDFRPDIVHAFAIFTHLSPSVLDACRERTIPVVLSCNDYKHICPNYKLFHHGHLCEECKGGNFYRSILNRCCHDSFAFSVASCIESYVHHYFDILRKNVDIFLFAGEFMAKKTEEFWGKETFRWRKLLNPYNSLSQPLCTEYEDYLLFFGRFVEEKGVDILLQAMALVPEAKLALVGDGHQSEYLRSIVKNLGLKNVQFLGTKWGENLDVLLRKSRFVVVPSVWHENFPYVILQTFAVGKAVIGTDRGGIPELIKDGEFGYIYPAEDVCALADRIRQLWHDPHLAVTLGKKAKEFVDCEFTDDKFYESLMEIYKEAIS